MIRNDMKASKTTRGETTKERKSRRWGGEREIASISRCRNKTNNISQSEWYRGHRETITA